MHYFLTLLKNLDKSIFVFVFIFAGISIVAIGSTAYDGAFNVNRDVIVQAAAYILGLVFAVIVMIIDYKMYPAFEKVLYVASILFLLTVYIPGLGIEKYGARSWIEIPGVTTLQPSEFIKLTFVVLVASYLSRHREDLASIKGVILSALYAAPFIVIVLKEDMGSAIVYCAIWIVMVFYAGIKYKLFFGFAGLVCACLPGAYFLLAEHQKNRILAFLHPEDLSIDANYQVWMSKVAIGSGGFFGKGLFCGTQKSLDFLPVQKSDFIFSVICEELGFIGGFILILLFTIFLFRLARIAKDAIDLYGALIVVGFIGMFAFQIFENIAMTMGLMPVTGITLPFISAGGSSVLANVTALGFIMSVNIRCKQINF